VVKLFTLTLAVLLQLAGGLVTWYGAQAMFTTAGLMPPNLIVIFGVLIIFLASVVAARSQPAPALGWWLGVALVSLPFVLIAMPGAGAECPPGHPPLTSSYNCVAPRPLAIFALGVAGIGVALWGTWRGIARLRRLEWT